jgi:hypothetical protein
VTRDCECSPHHLVLRCGAARLALRALQCLLPAALVAATGGCGTIHFDAPEGRRVKVLELDAPTSIQIERTVWFALWGAKPLSDNHTASTIEAYNLSEVRLHNLYSGSDIVINTFTSIVSFSRRRIIVEGNVAPEVTP